MGSTLTDGLVWKLGYPRKAAQIERDSGVLRAPLSRIKLLPQSVIKQISVR